MNQNKAQSCFNFEKQVTPYWREIYKDFFNIKEIKDVRDTNKGYDVEIITNDNKSYKIDEKTRRESYFRLFQKDNKILIEVCGNIEKEKQGSSILVSTAEYWAYGWFKNNKIINPIIFKIKPVVEYINKNNNELTEKISTTEGIYHTKNYLVPYEIIEKNQINSNHMLETWY